MNSLSETLKRFFTGFTSKNDLKEMFVCFNSEKGQDEVSRLLDKSWSSFDFKEDIYVDSSKILFNIREAIVGKKTAELKQKLKRSNTYATIILLIQRFTFYYFTNKKSIYSLPLPLIKTSITSIKTGTNNLSKSIMHIYQRKDHSFGLNASDVILTCDFIKDGVEKLENLRIEAKEDEMSYQSSVVRCAPYENYEHYVVLIKFLLLVKCRLHSHDKSLK